MKFGQRLQELLYPAWRFYYLDYVGLKHLLKRAEKSPFTDEDEAFFIETLERELDKVYAFHTIKLGELTRRVEFCEETINSTTQHSASFSAKVDRTEEEISSIADEINQLANFVRLNYSAFIKLIKKHDKHSGFTLKPMFMVRLNAKPFYRTNFDELLIRLSRLYEVVRQGGAAELYDAGGTHVAAGGTQNFERQTTKYWVHPENVMDLKLYVLRHLPVLVYNAKDSDQAVEPTVSSVYLDNESFDLYQGRLEKTEGAESVRLRWYGSTQNPEIFVERKTHHEDWTGESSIKARFPIKEKNVNAFLSGEYTVDQLVSKYRKRGTKSEAEIARLEQLAQEIQHSIITKDLKPVLRTSYSRMAFQLPGDARVRISLDTELCMIREDNSDQERSGSNWRRPDIGTFPFSGVPDSDIVRFPYAVLEVKLQTKQGTQPPSWIDKLIQSHLVEEVPKFSKYIHGVATLMESRVSLFPFWLPQMDHDIRKPPNIDIAASSKPPSRVASTVNMSLARACAATAANASGRQPQEAAPEATRIDVADEALGERTPLLERRAAAHSGVSTPKNAPQQQGLWRFLRVRGNGDSAGHPTANRQASAKRIHVPVRVEPKVFFANERTFLSWLHFSIVLGTLSLGLLNFGDAVGRVAGIIFTTIAMGVMVYALVLYQWRAEMIRRREAGPYDERGGPVVLVVVLFGAIIVNFYLKFTE